MPSGGAAASVAGGLIGAGASRSAARAQQAAIREQVEEDRRQYDQNREDTAPYREVGQSAIFTLADLLGINARPRPVAPNREDFTTQVQVARTPGRPNVGRGTAPAPFSGSGSLRFGSETVDRFDADGYSRALAEYNDALEEYSNYEPSGELIDKFSLEDFEADPGYQFRVNEGQKALERSGAGRVFDSGATAKDLLRFGQDYGSQEYSNAWNRDNAEKTRLYNFIAGTAGSGQTATNQLINTNSAISRNIGNSIAQGGNVRAAGIVGQANAIQGGIGNASNAYQFDRFLDAYNNQEAA